MSLEVFGDEGNVPHTWEDTAMRQEFDEVLNRFRIWRRDFIDEFPSSDFAQAVQKAYDGVSDLTELMTGEL
jgi:hypothetical protein